MKIIFALLITPIFFLSPSFSSDLTDSCPSEDDIHAYIAQGDLRAVECLLQQGMDPNKIINPGCLVPRRLVHVAIEFDNLPILKCLVDAKARLTGLATSPFIVPIQNKQPKIIDFLCDNGARIDGEFEGETHRFLHTAIKISHPKMVKLSLDNNPDFKQECKVEIPINALQQACYWTQENKKETLDILSMILDDERCDPHHVGSKNRTALHFAAYGGSCYAINALLDRKVTIDALDVDGNTPLHNAVRQKNFKAVALLLERGANPHTPNKDKITPESLAYTNKDQKVLEAFDTFYASSSFNTKG